ncbi:MAG: FAD binding domain-containing protein [Chloroflexi bacterium]|nr:FAD binding domain-containing protein [Chloroflexota bacterium]MBI5828596.1 FAD binding domain-containing protein [Chloroflexota bacterium]
MTLWEHYHLPVTVDEALTRLAQYSGAARVVAGGTDLLLELQQGHRPPVAALVDINRVPEMRAIGERDGWVYVGAGVTHTAIVASPLLTRTATCLVESCGVIGGPQVRNVATLGGNVAHALPAGDGTISLVALDAEAEVAGPSGRSWRPMAALFKGPGQSAVDCTRELIVQFRFRPAAPGEVTAFKRIMRPQGVALPILGMAVWLRSAVASGEAPVVEDVRIAVGPAGPTPLRAVKTEALLKGRRLDEDALSQTAPTLASEVLLRTSPHRATSEYRRELLGALLERVLKLAAYRAQTGNIQPEGLGLA